MNHVRTLTKKTQDHVADLRQKPKQSFTACPQSQIMHSIAYRQLGEPLVALKLKSKHGVCAVSK